MEMTPQRWSYTARYSHEVFGMQDAHLAGLMNDAVAHGIPAIAVSADVGHLLQILTALAAPKVAIELGTLAGYSSIWIARGLPPGGKLITVELDDKHADFALAQFKKAGVADRIELVRGAALDVLPALAKRFGPGSVGLAFFDAIKTEYPEYWTHTRPMIAPGGVLIADNIYGSGDWWIDDEKHPSRAGADALSRTVAADLDFMAAAVPLREGLLIARRLH